MYIFTVGATGDKYETTDETHKNQHELSPVRSVRVSLCLPFPLAPKQPALLGHATSPVLPRDTGLRVLQKGIQGWIRAIKNRKELKFILLSVEFESVVVHVTC